MDDASFMDITSDDDNDSFSIPLSIRVQKRLMTPEDGGSSTGCVPLITDRRAVFPASSTFRKSSSTTWSGLAGCDDGGAEYDDGGAGSPVVRERVEPLKEVTSNIAGNALDLTCQSPGLKLNWSLGRKEQRNQNSDGNKRPKVHRSDMATHQGDGLCGEHLPYSPHHAGLQVKKHKSAKVGGHSESNSWSGSGNCSEHVPSKVSSQINVIRGPDTNRQEYNYLGSASRQLKKGCVVHGSSADFAKFNADISSSRLENATLGQKGGISEYSPLGTITSSLDGDVLSPAFRRNVSNTGRSRENGVSPSQTDVREYSSTHNRQMESPHGNALSLLDVLLSDDPELPQSDRYHDNMGRIRDRGVAKDQSPESRKAYDSSTVPSPAYVSPGLSEPNVKGKDHNRNSMRSKLLLDFKQKTVDRGHTYPVLDFLEEAPDYAVGASVTNAQNRFNPFSERKDEHTPSNLSQWPSRHAQWSDSCTISGTSASDEDCIPFVQLGQTGLPPNTPAEGEAPSVAPGRRPRIRTTLKSTNGSWKVLCGTAISPRERHVGRGESIEGCDASTKLPAVAQGKGERVEEDEEHLPPMKLSSQQHAEKMRTLFGSSSEEEDDSEMQYKFQKISRHPGSSGEAAPIKFRKLFGRDVADEERHGMRHDTKHRHSRNGHLRSRSKSQDGSKNHNISKNRLRSIIFPSSEEDIGMSSRDSRSQTSQSDHSQNTSVSVQRAETSPNFSPPKELADRRYKKKRKSEVFESSGEDIGTSSRDSRNQTFQSAYSQNTSASFQRTRTSPNFSPSNELADLHHKKKRKSEVFESKYERDGDEHYKKRNKYESCRHVIPAKGDNSGKPRAKTTHQTHSSAHSPGSSDWTSIWPLMSGSGINSATRPDGRGHDVDDHDARNRSGSSVSRELSSLPDVERRSSQSPLKFKGKSETVLWPSSVPKPGAHVSPIFNSVDGESRVKPAIVRGKSRDAREDSISLLSPKPASGHRQLQSVVQVPPARQDASVTPSNSVVGDSPVTLIEDDSDNDDDIMVLDDYSYAASLVNRHSRKRQSHVQGGAREASSRSKTSPVGGAADQPPDRDAVSPATLERFKQLDDDEAMARQLQEQFDAEMAQSVHQLEERAGQVPTSPIQSGFNATYSNQSLHAGTFPSGAPCGQSLPPGPNVPGPGAPVFQDRIPSSWDLSFQPASSLVDMHRHHDNHGRGQGRGPMAQVGGVGRGGGGGGRGSSGGDNFWHLSSVVAVGVDPIGQPPLYITPPRPPRRRRGRHRRRHGDHSQEIPSGGNDYEALLQLAERLGPAKDKRLTQAAIERLPTFRFREEQHQGTDEEKVCPICMDDYEEGAELRRLPCFHDYHKACIDMWLKKGETPLCPICRVEVRIE